MEKGTIGKLKYLMNKNRSISEICMELDIELVELYDMILELKTVGFGYDIIDGNTVKVANTNEYYLYDAIVHHSEELCFFSDPHCGSIYDRMDLLESIMDICNERGITKAFCCGDLTDGLYPNRQNHPSELKAVGPEASIEYFVNNFPECSGLSIYIILGNHDKTFVRNDGVDIGEGISEIRKEFIYTKGDIVDLVFDKLKIRMLHGDGITAHNIRVNPKSYVRTCFPDETPDIIQMGHTHKSFYKKQDETHILQTASLMDETKRAHSMHLYGERSCWFVRVDYDERGNVIRIEPELMKLGKSRIRRKS